MQAVIQTVKQTSKQARDLRGGSVSGRVYCGAYLLCCVGSSGNLPAQA